MQILKDIPAVGIAERIAASNSYHRYSQLYNFINDTLVIGQCQHIMVQAVFLVQVAAGGTFIKAV